MITLTAATGLCLLATGTPAASADTSAASGALVRAATSSPWKTAMRRGVRHVSPPTVAPAVLSAPLVTVLDPATAFAARIVSLTNDARSAAGLPALPVATCATRFAAGWSGQMAATGDFSHQPLSPILTSCAARSVGENIAYGGTSPEQFASMWMASPAHRANILSASFTHIGVGVARSPAGTWYATQDFLTL